MKSDQITMKDLLLLIIIMVMIIVIIILIIVTMNVGIVFLPGGSPTSFVSRVFLNLKKRNATHQMFCCSKLYGQTTLDFIGRRATICLSDRVLSYP